MAGEKPDLRNDQDARPEKSAPGFLWRAWRTVAQPAREGKLTHAATLIPRWGKLPWQVMDETRLPRTILMRHLTWMETYSSNHN